jgi:CRP-like cAMP-binding protein
MFDSMRAYIRRFAAITDQDWALLEPHLAEKKIAKHDCFTREGKVCTEIAFVTEGCFRHFYTKDGEEKTTYFYFENNLMTDYFSCISGKPGLLTIEALTDSSVIAFPYKVLLQLYTANHNWEHFGRIMAEYLAGGLEERMVGLLTLSPEERYAQLLNSSNKQKILERIPQHLIANYLGVTPVSLSRIRNRYIRRS